MNRNTRQENEHIYCLIIEETNKYHKDLVCNTNIKMLSIKYITRYIKQYIVHITRKIRHVKNK